MSCRLTAPSLESNAILTCGSTSGTMCGECGEKGRRLPNYSFVRGFLVTR